MWLILAAVLWFVFSAIFGNTVVHRIGKKAAGRLLDGVEHNEFPEVKNG
jgi:hypothetical protein